MKRGLWQNDKLMIIGLVAIAALVIYTSGVIKKDCGRDKLCFQGHFQECKTARLITIKNDNVYSYTVESSFSSSCNMRVRMERIALGADPHFEQLLEDRDMYCKIPREQLAEVDPDNFNTFIDYCSGELKEGLYELVIERMYTLVVKELQGILQQSEKALLERV
ncbi:MAG TPA: hypothetical protein VJJ75_01320 [Candidatus Nanoarchaeia archaeon]|nr:hypothetical protein [Candidatus Nanoarchaeia archaeon]